MTKTSNSNSAFRDSHLKKAAASPPTLEQAAKSALEYNKTIVDLIERVPINALKPHPKASRTHPEDQIASMMGSFGAFGFLNPILVNDDNVILAGHARWEAAKRLGLKWLPMVRIGHLSPAEQRAYMVADNQIATNAGWDIEVLAEELIFFEQSGIELATVGITLVEADIIIGEAQKIKEKPEEEEAIPEPVLGPATSRVGDIWQMKGHRLACGSALEPNVLEALMGGYQARMVLTDFPYNVKISGFVSGLGKVEHREFAMASGEMSSKEFRKFLIDTSELAIRYLIKGGLFYSFMDWRGLFTLTDALQSLGLAQINLCVWNKGQGGMGSLYRSQHELCVVFKHGSEPHLNNVMLGKNGRNRTNVWDHPGMSSFGKGRDEALAMHPTVKPINLLVEAMLDVTHRGDIVLDPFLGSGSTLIAAEKCGRICYGVELDPLYADTIVRRFETLTGTEPVNAFTGKTFAETKAIREAERLVAADKEAEAALVDEPAVVIRKRCRPAVATPVAVKTEADNV